MNRYYGMATGRAGVVAAALVLVSGAGMIVCGWLERPVRPELAVAQAVIRDRVVLLSVSCCSRSRFHLAPGVLQLTLIAAGMFVAAGTAGPAGAMVANLTHAAIHGTAFATLTLANNLLGLAPGPFVTGALADRLGLQTALQMIPCISLAAALAFLIGKRNYERDLQRVQAFRAAAARTSAV